MSASTSASSPTRSSNAVAKVDMGETAPNKPKAVGFSEVGDTTEACDDGTSSREPSRKLGRSISSFFKKLFKSSDGSDGPAVDPSAKSFGTSVGQAAKKLGKENPARLLKSTFSFNAGAQAHITPHAPESPRSKPGGLASTSTSPAVPTRLQEKGTKSTLLAMSTALPPSMQREVWCLSDYAIVEKIYTGYASTVYKAWCKLSGETVCLKAYNMANLCELNRFQIYREIKLHGSLQHENIITLFAAFQEADQVVLVQEYAESGDLFLLLHRYGGKLPERTAVEMVLYPFLRVLNYMHQNCVVHRDIKPENVLFTRSMVLKLCDFGLAIDLREERAVTRAGTLEYMAPEVLNCPFKNRPEENKEKQALYYSLTVDTWAVGVLTYELLVGFPPFNDKQRAAIEDKIREDTPRFPSAMNELAQNFITKALQKDALERPTIMELLAHPWIKAHRRNNSMRNIDPCGQRKPQGPQRPSNLASSKSFSQRNSAAVIVSDSEDEDESNPKAEGQSTMATSRDAAGQLVGRKLNSFQSFSAGDRHKKEAQVGLHTKSSVGNHAGNIDKLPVNPKLAILRSGLH
eukprot:gene27062-2293_t